MAPVIVDSRHIQSDPEGVLSELCTQCNIPFDENMLEWPAVLYVMAVVLELGFYHGLIPETKCKVFPCT